MNKDSRSEADRKPGSIKTYTTWLKMLHRDETLRKMAQKSDWDIRTTAVVITTFGSCGTGCWPSAESVAGMIGCTEKTVKRHRAELIRLEWLVQTGYKGKVPVVSIGTSGSPDASPVYRDMNEGYRDTEESYRDMRKSRSSGHEEVPQPIRDQVKDIDQSGSGHLSVPQPRDGSADATPKTQSHETKHHAASPVSPDPDKLKYPADYRGHKPTCQWNCCHELATVAITDPVHHSRNWKCGEHAPRTFALIAETLPSRHPARDFMARGIVPTPDKVAA